MSERSGGDMKLSRREFLGLVAGAVSLSHIGEVGASENEKQGEQPFLPDLDRRIEKSKVEKVSYPVEPKSPGPDVLKLVTMVGDLTDTIVEKLGIANVKFSDAQEVSQQVKVLEIEELKRRFWEKAKADYPSANLPEYSKEGYSDFMVRRLPRILAPYGIMVKPLLAPIVSLQEDSFEDVEILFAFYNVKGVTKTEVEIGGESFERDIVSLSGPFEVNGKAASQLSVGQQTPGQTFYQNILLHEQLITENEELLPPDRYKLLMVRGERIYQSAMARATNLQEASAAGIVGYCLKYGPRIRGLERERIVAHETGHVLDDIKRVRANKLEYPLLTTPAEFFRKKSNAQTHEEILGALGELRNSEDKAHTIITMLCAGSDEIGHVQDYSHDRAISWVRDKFVDLLLDDPDKYHLVEISLNGVEPTKEQVRLQVIAQLASFIATPEVVTDLAGRIEKEYLKTGHLEDLSGGYEAIMKNEGKKGGDAFNPKIIERVVAGAALGGMAYLAKRFISRRNEGLKEKSLGQMLSEIPGAALLIDNLQLKIAPDKVDIGRRNHSIKEIISRSANPDTFEDIAAFLTKNNLLNQRNQELLEHKRKH